MLRLRQKREEKGWSRSKLARHADMVPSDVGKIEAGRLRPYETQLRKLARALGVSATEAPTLLLEVSDTNASENSATSVKNS